MHRIKKLKALAGLLFCLGLLGCVTSNGPKSAKKTGRTVAITRMQAPATFERLQTSELGTDAVLFCAIFATKSDKIYYQNSKIFPSHIGFLTAHVPQFEGLSPAAIELLMRIPDTRELRCGEIYRLRASTTGKAWGITLRASEHLALDDIQIVLELIERTSFIQRDQMVFLLPDQAAFDRLYRGLLGHSIVSEMIDIAVGLPLDAADPRHYRSLVDVFPETDDQTAELIDPIENRVLSSLDDLSSDELEAAIGSFASGLLRTEAFLKMHHQSWNEPLVVVPYSASIQHLKSSVDVSTCQKASASCNSQFGSQCQLAAGHCIATAQSQASNFFSLTRRLGDAARYPSARHFLENLIAATPVDSSLLSKIRMKLATTFGAVNDLVMIPSTAGKMPSRLKNVWNSKLTLTCNSPAGTPNNCRANSYLDVHLRQLNSLRFAGGSVPGEGEIGLQRLNRTTELSTAISGIFGSELSNLDHSAVSITIRPMVAPIAADGYALLRPTPSGFEVAIAAQPGIGQSAWVRQPHAQSEQMLLAVDSSGRPLSNRRIKFSNQIYPRSIILNDKHLKNLARRLHGQFEAELLHHKHSYPRRLWARFLADEFGDVMIYAASIL